jgi:NADPH-ferrihemoprotein reductase
MEPQALGLVALAVIAFLFVLLKLKGSGGAAPGGGKAGKGSTKTVVDVEADADGAKPVIRILYGTQTGTAERFSKALGAELRRKYGDSTLVDVTDVENYKGEDRLGKERLVLFLMATYGDGEPTDNAADFYSWITAEAEAVENGEKEPYMQAREGPGGRGGRRGRGAAARGRRARAGGSAARAP